MNVTYSASCLVFAISSCEPFIVDGVVAELTEELAGKYWSFVLSFAVANSTTNLKRHFNPTLLELGGRQNTPGYFLRGPFRGGMHSVPREDRRGAYREVTMITFVRFDIGHLGATL